MGKSYRKRGGGQKKHRDFDESFDGFFMGNDQYNFDDDDDNSGDFSFSSLPRRHSGRNPSSFWDMANEKGWSKIILEVMAVASKIFVALMESRYTTKGGADSAGNFDANSASLFESSVKDPYACLELPTGADADAVKKQYRKMALKYHPDRHANASEDEKKEAEVKMKEINWAHETIKKQWEDRDDSVAGGMASDRDVRRDEQQYSKDPFSHTKKKRSKEEVNFTFVSSSLCVLFLLQRTFPLQYYSRSLVLSCL
jgi:hypothetical protein